jgi:hypothetical protein
MSYNPNRANKAKARQRRYDPHAGVKRSDIAKRREVGSHAPIASRENTRFGYTSEVFSGPSFTNLYMCLLQGNNTGIGVTHKGDRSIRIMNGILFVTTVTKTREVVGGVVQVSDQSTIEKYTAGHTAPPQAQVTQNFL